jgi:hypothetical protein
MGPLKVLLLHRTTGSGKTYLTERVFGIEYDVHTAKIDSIYYQALRARWRTAGLPTASTRRPTACARATPTTSR